MFVKLEVGQDVYNKQTNQKGTIVGAVGSTYLVQTTVVVGRNKDGSEASVSKTESWSKLETVAAVTEKKKESEKSEQELVADFHRAFKYSRSDEPVVIPAEEVIKRVAFIQEELIELLAASVDTESELYHYMNILNKKTHEAVQKELPKVGHKDELQRIVEQSDALVDILVFTFGSGDISGVQLKPLFNIVMEANQSKLGNDGEPIYNEFGKIMKNPDTFVAPEPKLLENIKQQIKEAENQ